MKKIISLFLAFALIITPFSVVKAEEAVTIGSSGETKPSVSRGGANVHEFPVDSAMLGYRVYLVPEKELFDNGSRNNIMKGSTYEEYSYYATYCINKTKLGDGEQTRLRYSNDSKTKFSFSDDSQTLGDFMTLNPGYSDKWLSLKNSNFYYWSDNYNLLIAMINESEGKAPRAKGMPSGNDYPESTLIEWISPSGNIKKFYEIGNSSVLHRNWAVTTKETENFFTDTLKIEEGSPAKDFLNNKGASLEEAIKGFYDYTTKFYNSAEKKLGSYEKGKFGVVIEPVFGYNHENISKPVLMTATQYARWAMDMNSNYVNGHGIMYWYEQRSGSKANYVWGRTSNSGVTKLWASTAYNYASSLRPYGEVSDRNKLNEYGGFGILYPIPSDDTKLSMSIMADYVYEVDENNNVKTKGDSDSAYNYVESLRGKSTASNNKYDDSNVKPIRLADGVLPSSSVTGGLMLGTGTKPSGKQGESKTNLAGSDDSYESSAATFKDEKQIKGYAKELNGTKLIRDEYKGKVTQYYTALLKIEDSDNKQYNYYADIKDFTKKYGLDILDLSEQDLAAKLEDEINKAVIKALSEESELWKKPYKEVNGTGVIYPGLPEMSNEKRLKKLGDVVRKEIIKDTGLNIGDLDIRKGWGDKKAYTDTLDKKLDKSSISEVDNLTTQYSGDIDFIVKDKKIVLAKGYIPVTVAIVSDIPEVISYYKYFTYMIEDNKEKTTTITNRGNKEVKHSSSIEVSPFYEGITEENKAIAQYFAFTFDNYTLDGKYVESKDSSLVSLKEIEKFIHDKLNKNKFNDNNNTKQLETIASEISTKFNVNAIGTEYHALGDGSTNKKVVLKERISKDNLEHFGTQAIIIEYIDLNSTKKENESGKDGDMNSDIKEYELNKLSNFYIAPLKVVSNKFEVSDPGFRLTKSTETEKWIPEKDLRQGAPNFNNAPIISTNGYGIETYLNNTGLSILNPIYKWKATRTENYVNANGSTSRLDTDYFLYAISRANLGDGKNIADYSALNTGKYSANKKINGVTTKEILSKLGYEYSIKPVKDKSNESGKKENVDLSGKSGTQKLLTAKDSGWIVNDKYSIETRHWVNSGYWSSYSYDVVDSKTGKTETKTESYWVDTSHWSPWVKTGESGDTQRITKGKFYFVSADGSNGDVNSAEYITNRAYNIKFKMDKYTSFTNSDKSKGSINSFSKTLQVNKKDINTLSKSKIVNTETLITSLDFKDVSKSTLGVYPEVLMQYYTPKDSSITFNSKTVSDWTKLGGDALFSNAESHQVYTVGEKARYFNPTSLLTLEVYGKDNKASLLNEEDVNGELISNAFSTSTKVDSLLNSIKVDKKTPVMLSGGGYTVGTDKALKLQLTSYSLDINDEAVSSTGSKLNMKKEWSKLASGNYSADKIHESFYTNIFSNIEQKLSVVVDSDKQQITEDLKLKSNENKVLSNATKDNYLLIITDGKVSNKDDVINQIADGLMSESTKKHWTRNESIKRANEIYSSLDIENMVIPQLESINSKTNKSDKLGTTGVKWYDEAVSTIIIRKYTTDIEIGTVNASDKLDITWGAKQNNNRNELYTDGNKAGIMYTLGITEGFKLPSGVSVNGDKVLLKSMIKNCNFVIPDATIADSRY